MHKVNVAKAIATLALLAFVAAFASTLRVRAAADETYDITILNARVMDPESGLDAICNVGIRAGKIAAISATPLSAKSTIDAKGLVVAPGFIDLHEHGQEPRNYEFQAREGVTTSLELEAGTDDVDRWYAFREGKSLINFGVSIGHIPVRMRVMGDPQNGMLPTGEAAHRAASPEEFDKISVAIDKGFRRGALAEGMGVNYTPGATHWEIVEMFRIAAKYGASVHVHLRYGGLKEPNTGLAALEAGLAAAGGIARA